MDSVRSVGGRRGQYLFRRAGSANWHIRLVFPRSLWAQTGRKKEFSLGTPNRQEAMAAAARHIQEHQTEILGWRTVADLATMMRAASKTKLQRRRFEVNGIQETGEGRVFVASDTMHWLDEAGGVIRSEPNLELDLTEVQVPTAEFARLQTNMRIVAGEAPAPPPPPLKRRGADPDREIIEQWIEHRRVTKYVAAEGRAVFDLFREITGNKPLKDCTRADGRKLVAVLAEQRDKWATQNKKIGHLRSACNIAIDDGLLTLNPFVRVVPAKKDGDALKRQDISDADMARVNSVIDGWRPDERLLWRMLASTGMRLSECWHATEDFYEQGIRHWRVGSKTDSSKRRVPVPDCLLAHLPARIEGGLFTDIPKNVGKRLLRRMRDAGITDKRKVLHSLRHRALTKLRAVSCPKDVREWIAGHERKSLSEGYGEGPPVTVLKPWIDRIGLG